jgi:hypothetical protein
MICLATTMPGGIICSHTLKPCADAGRPPRHWRCRAGHEWWGLEGQALRSTPWPSDLTRDDAPDTGCAAALAAVVLAALLVVAVVLLVHALR